MNCDKVPLHGALDVASVAMASVVCGNVSKKESQRPGLFRDAFPCARCKEGQDVPDDIVHKVIFSCSVEYLLDRVGGPVSVPDPITVPSGQIHL